jgi:hypothetical protein
MIQVNELRVGIMLNVLNPFTNEWKIEAIKGKTIMNFHENPTHELMVNNFKPIPITEEILLKCGFVQCENEFWYQKNIISISPSVGTYEIQGSKLSLSVMRENPIRYLHQLQNLYWCLCGEELTFNNK